MDLRVDTPGVEPTHNVAGRTLRNFVSWRKISFGPRTPRGSRYVGRIMTAVGSCKLQGRNPLTFLTHAIQAHWEYGAAPSLIQDLFQESPKLIIHFSASPHPNNIPE